MIRTSCGRRLVVSGGFCAVFAAACSTVSAIVAFPGAEGFGANSTGGRGGDVYHVTTLVDDPNHLTPGSLFYGLYSKNVPAAGRTIVFDVGGTIHLGSNTLDIKNIRNVTIAGQTAPSPITIIGNTVQVTSSGGSMTSNIVMQYLSIRKGLENSGDSLSIKGAGTTSNIMADHISASWSEDEVISVAGATNHATNVTVQYCTMSEALTSGHQYGALVRNDESASVSYIHNLFSQNASRNPRPGTYLNTQLDFEFQNNVIYNWSDRAGYTGGASETDTENVNMNYVGNYLIAGPNTPASARTVAFTKDISNAPKDPLNLHFYQSGNKIDSTAGATRDGVDSGWGMFSQWERHEFLGIPRRGSTRHAAFVSRHHPRLGRRRVRQSHRIGRRVPLRPQRDRSAHRRRRRELHGRFAPECAQYNRVEQHPERAADHAPRGLRHRQRRHAQRV